jgi:hypothetical protein
MYMNDYTSIYVYIYDKQPIIEVDFALMLEGTYIQHVPLYLKVNTYVHERLYVYLCICLR